MPFPRSTGLRVVIFSVFVQVCDRDMTYLCCPWSEGKLTKEISYVSFTLNAPWWYINKQIFMSIDARIVVHISI